MGTLRIFTEGFHNSPSSITKVSLGLENTLLRGARLKDTEFIYGIYHLFYFSYQSAPFILQEFILTFLFIFRVRCVHWPRH